MDVVNELVVSSSIDRITIVSASALSFASFFFLMINSCVCSGCANIYPQGAAREVKHEGQIRQLNAAPSFRGVREKGGLFSFTRLVHLSRLVNA